MYPLYTSHIKVDKLYLIAEHISVRQIIVLYYFAVLYIYVSATDVDDPRKAREAYP